MKEPKLKIGTYFSMFLSIESLIFAVLTYLSFPFLLLSFWLLVGAMLCLVAFFIDFYIQYKEFYKSIKDLSTRHTALSVEYDNKNKILDEYESAFVNIGHLIMFGMAKLSQNEKNHFANLFRVFNIHRQNISGVRKNEKNI